MRLGNHRDHGKEKRQVCREEFQSASSCEKRQGWLFQILRRGTAKGFSPGSGVSGALKAPPCRRDPV